MAVQHLVEAGGGQGVLAPQPAHLAQAEEGAGGQLRMGVLGQDRLHLVQTLLLLVAQEETGGGQEAGLAAQVGPGVGLGAEVVGRGGGTVAGLVVEEAALGLIGVAHQGIAGMPVDDFLEVDGGGVALAQVFPDQSLQHQSVGGQGGLPARFVQEAQGFLRPASQVGDGRKQNQTAPIGREPGVPGLEFDQQGVGGFRVTLAQEVPAQGDGGLDHQGRVGVLGPPLLPEQGRCGILTGGFQGPGPAELGVVDKRGPRQVRGGLIPEVMGGQVLPTGEQSCRLLQGVNGFGQIHGGWAGPDRTPGSRGQQDQGRDRRQDRDLPRNHLSHIRSLIPCSGSNRFQFPLTCTGTRMSRALVSMVMLLSALAVSRPPRSVTTRR
jgi:hypothetical protein